MRHAARVSIQRIWGRSASIVDFATVSDCMHDNRLFGSEDFKDNAVRAFAVELGAGEDLQGARDVEALHRVEEDDEDGSHAVDSRRAR